MPGTAPSGKCACASAVFGLNRYAVPRFAYRNSCAVVRITVIVNQFQPKWVMFFLGYTWGLPPTQTEVCWSVSTKMSRFIWGYTTRASANSHWRVLISFHQKSPPKYSVRALYDETFGLIFPALPGQRKESVRDAAILFSEGVEKAQDRKVGLSVVFCSPLWNTGVLTI